MISFVRGIATRDAKRVEHPDGAIVSTASPWAAAANEILDRFERDFSGEEYLLFMDDDVALRPETFGGLEARVGRARVWGPMLVYPHGHGGEVQSAGHIFTSTAMPALSPLHHYGQAFLWPHHVAHVSASCFLVHRSVVEAGIRFPSWPGLHYEDVAFTIDCWRAGFPVGYWPTPAIHDCRGGVGATKASDPDFEARRATNLKCLDAYYEEINLRRLLLDAVVPLGGRVIQ